MPDSYSPKLQFPANFPPLPQAKVNRNGSRVIATSSTTNVDFFSADYDLNTTTPQWSAGDPTKLTCRVAGLYEVGANVEWEAVAGWAGADSVIFLAVNGAGGSFVYTRARHQSFETPIQTVSGQTRLAVGDYVELWVFQNTGSGLNIVGGSGFSIKMWWRWVSP